MIREGILAGVVILNADRIQDRVTWKEPSKYPFRIHYVLVNDKIVISEREHKETIP